MKLPTQSTLLLIVVTLILSIVPVWEAVDYFKAKNKKPDSKEIVNMPKPTSQVVKVDYMTIELSRNGNIETYHAPLQADKSVHVIADNDTNTIFRVQDVSTPTVVTNGNPCPRK